MRLCFLGTPACAVPSLRAVIEAGHEVGLVVTQPDRGAGRGRKPAPSAVKQAALSLGLELLQPTKVRVPAFRERVRAASPELLVVVAYGRILPANVLEVGRRGAVNVHFSLLPKYRGAAPVQWALARGEVCTGVTTMRMNERMDEGDVLLRREVAIEQREHAPALERRLAAIGARLLVETLAGLTEGSLEPVAQDHAQATLAPLLRRSDGEVDPALPAREIEGRIRGFDPWPGVWLARRGRRLRLVAGHALDEPPSSAAPGTLEQLRPDGVVLVCGRGSRLLLSSVQPEGRRMLAVRDAVNGRQLAVGERLERVGGAG